MHAENETVKAVICLTFNVNNQYKHKSDNDYSKLVDCMIKALNYYMDNHTYSENMKLEKNKHKPNNSLNILGAKDGLAFHIK